MKLFKNILEKNIYYIKDFYNHFKMLIKIYNIMKMT